MGKDRGGRGKEWESRGDMERRVGGGGEGNGGEGVE